MSRTVRAGLLIGLMLAATQTVNAQIGGGFGGGAGGVGGFGGGGNGNGNGNNQNAAGIKIDAEGVLSLSMATDGTGLLEKKQRVALSKKHLSQDLNQRSKLRCVSLVRLEKYLDTLLSKNEGISDELFFMAGLQRIEHLFVDLDEHDVLIAGPAEGFVPDAVGRMVGVESSRPVLRLDDFYVALRAVSKARQVGCSIDPVPQRLADLLKFIKAGVPASVEEVEDRFNQMDDILGLQTVRIDGVPTDSHFATMLVEADYRMKRIAIGLENPAVKGLKSHLAMLGTNGNSMQRWWFVPQYDAISRSADALAFQFAGPRAQLLTEEEIADAAGNRFSAATTKKSIQAFAKQFSEKFPQLADKSPVFGELQNLIDWTVLIALLQKEQLPQRIGWKQELFLDESKLPHPKYETPKMVPSQVSYKRAGNSIVGLVCGGVVIHPQRVIDEVVAAPRNAEGLDAVRSNSTGAPRTESHIWWWDVKHD